MKTKEMKNKMIAEIQEMTDYSRLEYEYNSFFGTNEEIDEDELNNQFFQQKEKIML